MATDEGGDEPAKSMLSPDEAFGVLGDETRLQILQALGETREPLAFSELFERIAYDDSANFSYHLERLVGHFVRKTEDGYQLRLAGRRVVESILSGAVTESPVVDRSDVDMDCMYCGGPLELGYHEEVVVLYCTECENQLDRLSDIGEDWPIPATDVVGYVNIPPAGVYHREPTEVLEAAGVWTISGVQSIVRGVCPRCAAAIDQSIEICSDHDTADDFCDRCDHRFGVSVTSRCTNCIFETRAPFPTHALGNPDLMAFMLEHDIDPISPDGFHLRACEEEFVSTDPPEVRYTFTADGDSLSLTVDGNFPVVEAARQ